MITSLFGMIIWRMMFFVLFLLSIPITAAVRGLRYGIRGFATRDQTDQATKMEISTAMLQGVGVHADEETEASSMVEGFLMPRNLLYHPKHFWMKRELDGRVRIGFDDFALRLMGAILKIDMLTFAVLHLKKNGWQTLHSFLRGWDIHCDGKTVRIVSPIQGRVGEINDRLGGEPSLISEDPYGNGWLCTIVPEDDMNPMDEAISGMQIDKLMKDEVNRLHHYISDQGIAVLQDGGELVQNPAGTLSEGEWQKLVKAFISA